jgi:hypothetical protein
MLDTSFTHCESHSVEQQYESEAQIWATHGSQDEESLAPVTHLLCAQPLGWPQVIPHTDFTSLTHVESHALLQQ